MVCRDALGVQNSSMCNHELVNIASVFAAAVLKDHCNSKSSANTYIAIYCYPTKCAHNEITHPKMHCKCLLEIEEVNNSRQSVGMVGTLTCKFRLSRLA